MLWPRTLSPSPLRRFAPFLVALMLVSATSCVEGPSRDLSTLVVVDSVYVDPGSGEPFSGAVHRTFDGEPGRSELEGRLLDGTWHGELRIFHPNGRIRYMGSFHEGARCGPWTENVDSVRGQSVYDALTDEIESLGMYPPCPEER